jgi:hypothetical protein
MNISSQNMQQRVNLALKIGWYINMPFIEHGDDSKHLSAPKHFECRDYAAIWNKFVLKQGKISIPSYFNDDYVLTTGKWNDEHFFNTDRLQVAHYYVPFKEKKLLKSRV